MDIQLITLSSYVKPPISEDKYNDWVLNGKKNYFYQYIIDRNNGSPTNASINNTYASLIYGRGLSFTNGNVGVNNFALLQTYLRPKDLRKIISDFQVFNEFAVQVIRKRGGGLSAIKHIPKQLVAPSIKNENGEIDSYWYCENWNNTTKYKPQKFAAFGTSRDAIEIYVGKPYRVGDEYFTSPDYLSGLQYAEMEEEISNLNISSIKNGLSAGYIINIPDGKSWTPEDKQKFKDKVKRKLTGSPNASDFILSFNGRDVEISITPFPVNKDIHKQWDFLTREAKNQIMTAHRVISPSLVGLSSASGFSSVADEMDMSEKQTMKRVIKPKQDFILESIEEIIAQYEINLNLYFLPLTEDKEEEVTTEDGVSENVEMAGFDPNQTRDSDGKWSTTRDIKIEKQVEEHIKNGGSTFSQNGENMVGKKGKYSVSISEEYSKKIKKELTYKILKDYIDKYRYLLDKDSRYSIGTWLDNNTGITWLDIVLVTNLKNALQIAKEKNQIAIFDLENLVEIETGGTGLKMAGFDPNQARDDKGRWTVWGKMYNREKQIKDQNFETAIFVDKNGNILQEINGTETHVEIEKLPENTYILTHNHNNNSSFSRSDLLYILNNPIYSIRAVTPEGTIYELILKSNKTIKNTSIIEYWEQATNLAKKEVEDYANRLFKNDNEFRTYWRYREEKIKEVQGLFGRFSDRRMFYLINNTPIGEILEYNVY